VESGKLINLLNHLMSNFIETWINCSLC